MLLLWSLTFLEQAQVITGDSWSEVIARPLLMCSGPRVFECKAFERLFKELVRAFWRSYKAL